MRREHIQIGWKHFRNQFFKVLRNPIFFVLTIVGNTFLLTCAAIFYAFEHESNPAIKSFFDGLWWAVVTVTTVGYGDIVPVTLGGRLTAIGLMLTGSVLFLSFIALLASSFIELEFTQLESEVQSLRKDLERISKENH